MLLKGLHRAFTQGKYLSQDQSKRRFAHDALQVCTEAKQLLRVTVAYSHPWAQETLETLSGIEVTKTRLCPVSFDVGRFGASQVYACV
jgi:hypothetical protein